MSGQHMHHDIETGDAIPLPPTNDQPDQALEELTQLEQQDHLNPFAADLSFQDSSSLENSPKRHENQRLISSSGSSSHSHITLPSTSSSDSSGNPFGASPNMPGQFPVAGASGANGAQGQQAASSTSWFACCSIDYYRPHFNVSTEQIGKRLLKTLMPWRGPFFSDEDPHPDLYGPFWTCTTLLFLVASMGNLSDYIYHCWKSEDGDGKSGCGWKADFGLVSLAATALYSFIFILPLIIGFLLSKLGHSRPFVEIISLYGYSLCVYVPVSILCVFSLNWFRWLVVVIAFAFSVGFLLKNVWIGFQPTEENRNTHYLLLGVIIGMHVGWTLLLKLYFFSYSS